MRSHTFYDPAFKFKSTAAIGKHMVKVEIEGLPPATFVDIKLSGYIDHTPEASAALLKFHDCREWQMDLDDHAIVQRMCQAAQSRDFSFIAPIIQKHTQNLSNNQLQHLWENAIKPEIIRVSASQPQICEEALNTALIWMNPAVAGRKLHPRAIQFIQSHWPRLLDKHSDPEPSASLRHG